MTQSGHGIFRVRALISLIGALQKRPRHYAALARSCASLRAEDAIMDLGDWLRSLGLERYEAVFRENAIDPDVLRDLTEEHLRELGVPLGARLKLLKAIAELRGD